MKLVERFFAELAKTWRHTSRPTLHIIGSTALMLQTDFDRQTTDSDIFELGDLDASIAEQLLELGGRGSRLEKQWKLHIQIVKNGIPFLPHKPAWHPIDIAGAPPTLELRALDVVDVVVSKLKRFDARDIGDIDQMIDRGLVPHQRLVERFRSAVDVFSSDARAEDLPRYVSNLHIVERDHYLLDTTTWIDLPEWV